MRVQVINATVNEGISRKVDPNGRQYSIASLTVLSEFEPRAWSNANGAGQSMGYGLVTSEIELDPKALNEFKDIQYPAWLELKVDNVIRNGRTVSICVGVNKQPTLKTA